MVDVKNSVQPSTNPRDAIRDARARRMKLIKGASGPETVKVYAANELLRDVLRHANGTRFREDGSAEWPNDSFTQRRIAEGSVRTDGPGTEQGEPDESLNVRERAEARKPKQQDQQQAASPKAKSQQPPPTVI